MLKQARLHPSTTPSLIRRSLSYCLLHILFKACHIILHSLDLHSTIMCLKVFVSLQIGHTILSSYLGMFWKLMGLYIPCTCFQRRSLTFLVISLCLILFQTASLIIIMLKMASVVSHTRPSDLFVACLLISPLLFRC